MHCFTGEVQSTGNPISDERGGIDVQKRDDLLQTTEKRQGNSVKTHIKVGIESLVLLHLDAGVHV